MIKIILGFLLAIILVVVLFWLMRQEILNPTLDPHLDYRNAPTMVPKATPGPNDNWNLDSIL